MIQANTIKHRQPGPQHRHSNGIGHQKHHILFKSQSGMRVDEEKRQRQVWAVLSAPKMAIHPTSSPFLAIPPGNIFPASSATSRWLGRFGGNYAIVWRHPPISLSVRLQLGLGADSQRPLSQVCVSKHTSQWLLPTVINHCNFTECIDMHSTYNDIQDIHGLSLNIIEYLNSDRIAYRAQAKCSVPCQNTPHVFLDSSRMISEALKCPVPGLGFAWIIEQTTSITICSVVILNTQRTREAGS